MLSSARVVRCWVKSRNERNPYRQLPALPFVVDGNSDETAGLNRRKVGMTSSPHAPYAQGYTRATMADTKGRELARVS